MHIQHDVVEASTHIVKRHDINARRPEQHLEDAQLSMSCRHVQKLGLIYCPSIDIAAALQILLHDFELPSSSGLLHLRRCNLRGIWQGTAACQHVHASSDVVHHCWQLSGFS